MNFNSEISTKTSEICLLLFQSASENNKDIKPSEKFRNCYKYLEILIDLQKEYSIISKKDDNYRKEKLRKLFEIVTDNSKVQISKSEDNVGYGLEALTTIDKYEEVLRISENNMITEIDAYKGDMGSFFRSDPMMSSMPNVSLALFILNEMNNTSSKYNEYIESFPKDVDTYLYLTPADINLLLHSQYLNEIVRQFCNLCCHYCYLSRVLSKRNELRGCNFKDRFCFEDFRWAVSIIMSRNNGIPSNKDKSTILALIPIWDMMNHQWGEITTDFDNDQRILVFYSMKSYSIGEEIYMDYGKRSTLHYFMFSGFVPTGNPHDKYSLKLVFNKQDVLYEKKRQLLSLMGIDCNEVVFNIDYLSSNLFDQSIMSYLTVMMMNTDDEIKIFLESNNLEEEIVECSMKLKCEVEKLLLTRLKLSLACLEKTLKKNENSSKDRLDCLDLLRHEKFVLELIISKLLL